MGSEHAVQALTTCVFIDEYGNVDVDTEKDGVTSYFVVAAVVSPHAVVDELRRGIDAVRQRHCGTGRLKSKLLAKNPARFQEVVSDLGAVPFRFYALAVDKREILPTSGLIYGRSFYKFVQGVLYRQLFSTYSHLVVRADEYGSTDFMESFRRYLLGQRRPQLDLFASADIDFASDGDEPLVQLADVIAGALGRALEPGQRASAFSPLLELLRSHALSVEEWPTRFVAPPVAAEANKLSDDDRAVAELALRRAEQFLATLPMEPGPDDIARSRVLKRLLFESRFAEGDDGFVSTGELQEFLSDLSPGVEVTTTRVRSTIIGPMRDAGVLIASSHRGYKIPTTVADLRAFVDHDERIIVPMINRLKRAQEAVKGLTHGRVDLLGEERYVVLARAVAAVGRLGALDTPAE